MTWTDGNSGGEIATVAAAMVRHVLPAARSLRLEITADDCGTWLHLTYLASKPDQAQPPAPAASELAAINSAAGRWATTATPAGTLWALMGAP